MQQSFSITDFFINR